MNELVKFTNQETALIKATTCKGIADGADYNWCIKYCEHMGLDPIKRDVYFMYFGKGTKKQTIVPVISIDFMRRRAEKTGQYRPDQQPAQIENGEEKTETNPAGLLSATVAVEKKVDGEWSRHPVTVYWEEFAPLKEIWGFDKDKNRDVPSGEYKLEKDMWRRMPRVMLAKCAEAQALRRAFPDMFAGMYAQEELDQGEIIDITPTEQVQEYIKEKRLEEIGGPAIYFQEPGNSEIERVPVGKYADRVLEFMSKNDPSTVNVWFQSNRQFFDEFHASKKSDALQLMSKIKEKIDE